VYPILDIAPTLSPLHHHAMWCAWCGERLEGFYVDDHGTR
jgi:hypothetical protein